MPEMRLRPGLHPGGSPQYAASEIAADEIAAKNWPPMQRADILNRRLAFAATSLRRRINSRLQYIIVMKPSVFTIVSTLLIKRRLKQ